MNAEPAPSAEMSLLLARRGLDAVLEQTMGALADLAEGKAPRPLDIPDSSSLAQIARIFGLDHAEQQLLALLATCELTEDAGGALQALGAAHLPTPALAERLIGPRAWDILCPEAPLRHWRVVELERDAPHWARTMRIDERILHALLGTDYLDSRLEGLVHRLPVVDLPSGEGGSDAASRIVRAWQGAQPPPVIMLGGADRLGKRAMAGAAACRLRLQMLRVDAADIPAGWEQRGAIAKLLDREMALSGAAVLIEAGNEDRRAAAALADGLSGPVILAAEDPALPDRTPRLRIEMAAPGPLARRRLWHEALGTQDTVAGKAVDRLAAQFTLDRAGIGAAVAEAEGTGQPIWTAARAQGRRAIEGLAERIESKAGWDDLVLPEEQGAMLRDLEHHLRSSWTVNQTWGWAGRGGRGLGAAALFAGPSGTGKTLAAEVMAGALELDLYRIDLSQVVSKYIGETEKNLDRIFVAAEDGGAILLLDEADALLGKRSEVRDSHDRYANIEVSYLLQRMEAHRGLAILTSNMKSAIDKAFLRRLRYVVNFPFPDVAARMAIWQRILPPETPRGAIDFAALARLNLSGGSIRSVALNATFLAAALPEPVGMAHLGKAVRREYQKMEKPFTSAEQAIFR